MPRERQSEADSASAAPRPIWSGTISFGLVSVPVILAPAVRRETAPVRLLDADGTPLKRRYWCPADNREIHPEHIIRGYEVAEGRYVPISQEELEGLEPEKSRDIDLSLFVDVQQVDPIFFERPYFLLPDGESTKAYRLLAHTMEQNGQAGIARFVMRDKEYLVAIMAEAGILRAHTMRFFDEIRAPEDLGLPEPRDGNAKDVALMQGEIKKLARRDLKGADLADHQAQRLLKLIASKARQVQDIVESPFEQGEREPEVEDLMAQLQRSLGGTRDQDRHGRGDARSEPAARRARRKGSERGGRGGGGGRGGRGGVGRGTGGNRPGAGSSDREGRPSRRSSR